MPSFVRAAQDHSRDSVNQLQFVEVHHLIPMEKQNDFEDSLDVPENIVALCPNCHRKIHLASKSEKQPMIEAFSYISFSRISMMLIPL